MIGIRQNSMQGFYADEPRALQQINEQERARDELRAANRIEIEKSAYQGQTECFTMSRTKMDSNPLPTSTSPPDSSPTATPSPPVSPTMVEEPGETELSPLADIFLGPDGLYPGAR